MNPSLKITLGAVLSTFMGAAMFNNSCPGVDMTMTGIRGEMPKPPAPAAAPTPAAAPVPAATAAAVTECQGDINAVMTGKTVNFKSGSAYLAADSNALLDDVAKALKPCAGTVVEIQGHTDLVGGADTNLILSQSRADTVKQALITRGLAAETLTAKGYGATQPLENGINPSANAKNRRTIFSIGAAGAKPVTPQGAQ
jgi:outer membrane protein OmpA-like peptidoglycan-associated protein